MKLQTLLGAGLLALCIAAIVLGFQAVGSPDHRAKIKRDKERLRTLNAIVTGIYYQTNARAEPIKWKEVPTHLSDVQFETYNNASKQDPLTKNEIIYRKTDKYRYEVCITFELDAETLRKEDPDIDRKFVYKAGKQYCFELKITNTAFEEGHSWYY